MNTSIPSAEPIPSEAAVYNRYAAAAGAREESLCCPVEYRSDLLQIIPPEVIERDYGCGDPTRFVQPGDVVVDLGSGGGKLCFMMAQVVGPAGKVIGVDCNREMLALARKHREDVARSMGYANVEFRYGMIQDLLLDLDLLEQELARAPVTDAGGWLTLRSLEDRLRREQPLVPDASVDCVVSNCVLNLVRPQDRHALFAEIFRVLKVGGRAAISDIISDESVPDHLRADPELWSGCISGAFREDEFLQAFAAAGFHGIEIVKRQGEPWRTVEGIEFRSITVTASKGQSGPCLERNQAVIYRGPFSRVEDDDGHTYLRGERMAVCDKMFQLLQQPPYSGQFIPVMPRVAIPPEAARPFQCGPAQIRSPRETKGEDYCITTGEQPPSCDAASGCC